MKFIGLRFYAFISLLFFSCIVFSQGTVTYDQTDSVCSGNSLYLTINVSGSNGPYTWILDQLVGGSFTDTAMDYQPIQITPVSSSQQTYVYNFDVYDNSGNFLDDGTFAITVFPLPNTSIVAQGGITDLCFGDSTVLTAYPGSSSYQWAYHASLTSMTVQNPTAWPTTTTTYTVTVTDGNGCVNIASKIINVWPVMTGVGLNYSPLQDSLCSGSTINFSSTASGGTQPYSYLWQFGDGYTSTTKNPGHEFNTFGCGSQDYTINLTVTDSKGCSMAASSQSINVKKRPNPNYSEINNFKRCDNPLPFQIDLTNITGNSSCIINYDIDWGDTTYTTNLTNSTIASYDTHTYQQGTYDLVITATNDNGCQESFEQKVAHENVPTFVLSSSDNYHCYPDTVFIELDTIDVNTPGTEYFFNFGDGFDITYGHDSMMALNGEVDYIYTKSSCNYSESGNEFFEIEVKASNLCGFKLTKPTFFVWGPPVPEFTVSQNSPCSATGPYCDNCPVEFTNITEDSYYGQICDPVNATYYWDFGDGTDSLTASKSAIEHNYSNPGSYIVKLAVNHPNCGSDTTSMEVLIIDSDNAMAIAGPDTTGCLPMDVTLHNTSVGDSLDYSWSISPSTGWSYKYPSNASSINPTITFTTKGTYQVTLTSYNACSSDDTSFSIQVNDMPDISFSPLTDSCGSFTFDPVNISYDDNGYVILAYSWTIVPASGYQFLSGTNSGDANPSLGFTNPDTYEISIEATNSCGTDSSGHSFNVYPVTSVVLNNDTAICAGDTIAILSNVTGGVSPYSYQWNGLAGLSSYIASSPNAYPINTTTYVVTVTDANGCTASDNITITVHALPMANAGSDTTVCAGDTAMLSALQSTGSITSYDWSSGANSALDTVFPNTFTTYYLTVTDSNQCVDYDSVEVDVFQLPHADAGIDTAICYGDQIQISGAGSSGSTALTYIWDNGLGQGENQLVSPGDTTDYVLFVYDSIGCSSNDTMTIDVRPLPIAHAGSDDTICLNQSTLLDATFSSGNTPLTYSWNNSLPALASQIVSPTSSTTYILTVSDVYQCESTDTVEIIVNTLPMAVVSSDTAVCSGFSAYIDASSSSGNVPLDFSWSNGINTSAQTVSPSNTTIYQVTISDVNGCTETEDVSVTVNPNPIADAGLNDTICENAVTLINAASSTGSSSLTYFWDQGVGSGISHSVSPSNTITYHLTVSDIHSCIDVDSVSIIVNPNPIADAGPDQGICVGFYDTISAAGSSGNAPLTYTWNQGFAFKH